jgi:transcriptional regulator with XRE-family HTH domain
MGRRPINLKINGDALSSFLKNNDHSFSDRATQFGISKQAINGWITNGIISPRALAELAIEFNIPPDLLKIILLRPGEIDLKKGKKSWTIKVTLEEE